MAKYGKGSEVNPNMTATELLEFLLAISSGMTADETMRICKNLPKTKNSRMIVSAAIGASMNVKEKINEVVKKLNITLTPEMKINDSISMTFFAMLGHIFMMVPDSHLTELGKKAKVAYKTTIGNVEDISKFHSGVSMEGKAKRAEILLKWAGILKTFNVMKHLDTLSAIAPDIVKPTGFLPFRMIRGLFSVITYPIRVVLRPILWILGVIWSVIRTVLRYLWIPILLGFLTGLILPSTIGTIKALIALAPVPVTIGSYPLLIGLSARNTAYSTAGSFYGLYTSASTGFKIMKGINSDPNSSPWKAKDYVMGSKTFNELGFASDSEAIAGISSDLWNELSSFHLSCLNSFLGSVLFSEVDVRKVAHSENVYDMLIESLSKDGMRIITAESYFPSTATRIEYISVPVSEAVHVDVPVAGSEEMKGLESDSEYAAFSEDDPNSDSWKDEI